MSASTSKFVPLKKVVSPARHEWGWTADKKGIYIPWFLMGAPGEPGCVCGSTKLMGVPRLDRGTWRCIAKIIKENGSSDWDWTSLRKNIIVPNEEHIRRYCFIKDDAIWERFLEDGYVFLNSWFDEDEQDEDENGNKVIVKVPNGQRVFTDMDCEY